MTSSNWFVLAATIIAGTACIDPAETDACDSR